MNPWWRWGPPTTSTFGWIQQTLFSKAPRWLSKWAAGLARRLWPKALSIVSRFMQTTDLGQLSGLNFLRTHPFTHCALPWLTQFGMRMKILLPISIMVLTLRILSLFIGFPILIMQIIRQLLLSVSELRRVEAQRLSQDHSNWSFSAHQSLLFGASLQLYKISLSLNQQLLEILTSHFGQWILGQIQ